MSGRGQGRGRDRRAGGKGRGGVRVPWARCVGLRYLSSLRARNLRLPPRTRTVRTVTLLLSFVFPDWRPSSYFLPFLQAGWRPPVARRLWRLEREIPAGRAGRPVDVRGAWRLGGGAGGGGRITQEDLAGRPPAPGRRGSPSGTASTSPITVCFVPPPQKWAPCRGGRGDSAPTPCQSPTPPSNPVPVPHREVNAPSRIHPVVNKPYIHEFALDEAQKIDGRREIARRGEASRRSPPKELPASLLGLSEHIALSYSTNSTLAPRNGINIPRAGGERPREEKRVCKSSPRTSTGAASLPATRKKHI